MLAHHVFGADARDPLHRLVDMHCHAVRVDDPDAVINGIEQRRVFAGEQRRLRFKRFRRNRRERDQPAQIGRSFRACGFAPLQKTEIALAAVQDHLAPVFRPLAFAGLFKAVPRQQGEQRRAGNRTGRNLQHGGEKTIAVAQVPGAAAANSRRHKLGTFKQPCVGTLRIHARPPSV